MDMRCIKIQPHGEIIELTPDPLRWEPVQPSKDPAEILNQIEARGVIVKHCSRPDQDGVITVYVLRDGTP